MNVWRQLLDKGYPFPAIMQWLAQEAQQAPKMASATTLALAAAGVNIKMLRRAALRMLNQQGSAQWLEVAQGGSL